jgi:mutual gliding-motility protein MglA
MFLDFPQREIAIKLVYYGPALSGKTTNLQKLHELAEAQSRGRLMSLDTQNDRTLFFDLLPLHFRAAGVSVKIKVYTVPGQVMHNATRKIVLKGADGIAFIADSQVSETAKNNDAFINLKQNLRENGIDPEDTPIVIQFNKRDLANVRSDEELARLAEKGREPIVSASALRGDGVLTTFFTLVRMTWEHLDRKHNLAAKFGLGSEELYLKLGALFGKKLK